MSTEETVIHMTKESSPSSKLSDDFKTAREEPWGTRIEKYLREAVKLCDEKENQHEEAGYHFKNRKSRWGLPTIIVPALFAPITLMVGWGRGDTCSNITTADYVSAFGFMITAFFTGVYEFYNYGVKYQKHFNHAYIFGSISSKINAEMIRGRKFRLPADVFMVEINMEIDNAMRNEPILPKFLLKKGKGEKTKVQEMNRLMTQN